MDETEGDSRYLPNYGLNQGYGSTQRPKVATTRNVSQTHSQQIVENYVDEDEDDEEQDQEQEANGGDNEINGHDHDDDDDDDNTNTDNDDDNDNDNNDDDTDNFNLHRHPKKRKLKSLLASFELVPRATPPPPPLARPPPPPRAATKPSFGGRNTLTDWTEHETFALLESWGQRFLQRGRKSLRSEEWQEVAERVSHGSKIERTDTQCRNRLDTLKKKYKKEKALLQTMKPAKTKWVYFKKMDTLMSSTPQKPGEFVVMNPNVYVDRSNSNGLDETSDNDDDDDDDDSDLLPPKKSKVKDEKVNGGGGSFRLLADSINKFSATYEKIENAKRKQMMELEKMRMDFHKELESQKKQILERTRDEIAKIRRGDYEVNDNVSG